MNVIAIDILPDGSAIPVPIEDLPDWTQPPEGFTRPMRRRWKRLFKFYRTEYKTPEDAAWYFAQVRVLKEFKRN